MKRIFVNEKWCLGCRLCEYNCAFANKGGQTMYLALKNAVIHPNIKVEEKDGITYAVSCRHCTEPLCKKSCIAGAIKIVDGVVEIDKSKCVGCYTCVLVCPYGALSIGDNGVMQKCELCISNGNGSPACVKGCPNQAIVYEER
ncbi:MAG: 4Fe-4S binding protein [Firmicutes bacterium]|nr:4Fe-4S binding protein [Bacillota bacterium]